MESKAFGSRDSIRGAIFRPYETFSINHKSEHSGFK